MTQYPNITVRLTGEDGNSFMIIARVSQALRRGGVPADKINEFQRQATSGDYNNLLNTCTKWVKIT